MNGSIARAKPNPLDSISKRIEKMNDLSEEIKTMGSFDRSYHGYLLQHNEKVEKLETEFMVGLLHMTLNGTKLSKTDQSHYILPAQIRAAKLDRQELTVKIHTNWHERSRKCDLFRQELAIISNDSLEVMAALQTQGVQPTSVQTSQPKPKRSLWGRTGNPYAVEELDQ